MSYGYKGWSGKQERINGGLHRAYRHPDYSTPIFKGKKEFHYYRDSPGGQRFRFSFTRLMDAIEALEASE